MRQRLYRSRSERWIAGVCGGLSEYFKVDVSALRIAFSLLSLWHGVGLLFYLLLVLIVPDEPLREVASAAGPAPPEPPDEGEHQRRARTLGTVLVFGGAYLLIQQTQLFEILLQQSWIGVVLIVGGLLVLLLKRTRKT